MVASLKNKQFKHLDLHDFEELPRVTDPVTGKRYYQTPTGQKYPSMTTALKWMSQDAIAKWRKRVGEKEANKVSKQATFQGNHLHYMCENYIENNHEKNLAEKFYPHMATFESIKPLLNRIDNVVGVEKPLYSHRLRLAGQVDCIADFDGVPSIIDFKTTGKPKKEEWITSYFLQCTGYAKMFEERTGIEVPQIVIIMANNNSHDCQLFVKERKDYDYDFEQAIETYYSKYHK